MLAMTGPSVSADPGFLPVRGDLAHIKLAGRYFVPHYAVPMPHKVRSGVVLRTAGRADAGIICPLGEGQVFEVLDMTGGWAWGQVAMAEGRPDGPVGYVPLDGLDVLPR